jgi:hypothetical protein
LSQPVVGEASWVVWIDERVVFAGEKVLLVFCYRFSTKVLVLRTFERFCYRFSTKVLVLRTFERFCYRFSTKVLVLRTSFIL